MLKEYSTIAQLKPLSIPLKANQVNLPSSVKTHKVFLLDLHNHLMQFTDHLRIKQLTHNIT